MKTKRLLLDAGMVLLLPLMMAYSLIGERFHEVAGTLMLVFFLMHHWLNRGWWKALAHGKYTAHRLFRTALNLLLLLFMIAQPVCGIMMSKHLYTFLPTANLSSAVRAIHLPMANWGFVLMSLHAGTHLATVLPKGKQRKISLACIGAISLYSAYAFAKRQIPAYMFGKLAFVFFDYSEPIGFFILDYFAVMILFALAGYGFTKAMK